MKTQRTTHYLVMAMIVTVFAVATWSCNKDDDPSLADLREDRLQYLEDSLRISDSLKRINAAGIVNYTITVINGSTSSLNNNGSGVGRSQATKTSVEGAIVTISQYGKVLTDTTDASGLVVFNGFFRSAVNVNIKATDFTEVNYIAAVSIGDSTRNSSISFVGNIIPIFETTGANTSTISGRATLQSNLTNKALELVPDGTTVLANIDAKNSLFESRFLTYSVDNVYNPACGCDILFVGELIQTAYSTGVIGTVTGGNYSLTVPAAVDGLPISLSYSELAADQTLFEDDGAEEQHTIVRRTVFNDNSSVSAPLAALPTGSTVGITFESRDVAATATAVISANTGTIERINITDGGSGYLTGVGNEPLVQITGGGGTGATATATVGANGRVTAITLTSPGTGYTSAPSVVLLSGGTTATATSTLDANNQSVFSISVTAQGTGYTSAPTVTFTGGGGAGATATAQVANGRVVAVVVTASGSAYTAAPTVTFTGGGGAGATATALMGQPVAQVNMVLPGSNHVYAPAVTFSAPQFVNGTRAQGQAIIDPATRTVLGVMVTNPGSGYTAAPTVTLNGGSGATAQSFLTGGSVIGFNITLEGANYAYAPTVIIGAAPDGSGSNGNGSGATGVAVMSGGRVVGINVTAGGSGYTSAPTVTLVTGDGAVAYATVNNGVITGFTVSDGGHGFAGAPRVEITGDGSGATATATVAGGQITGITVVNGGSGYLDGNTPGTAQRFSATKGTAIQTKPGITYINDIYYGTGAVRSNL